VVLNNAEHSAFTDRALPSDHEPRNPNHHRVILALSTAFWDVFARQQGCAGVVEWCWSPVGLGVGGRLESFSGKVTVRVRRATGFNV
jgi:hypothetical protein